MKTRSSFENSIELYSHKLNTQILDVWEKSVLATHDFLDPVDFEEIKQQVKQIHFEDFTVYCYVEHDTVLGFAGVHDQKIEMLFVLPEYFGKGIGKALVQYAISRNNAFKVDVNEQNKKAVEFYKKRGFTVYERTVKDDQGKNYPLLRMKLERGNS